MCKARLQCLEGSITKCHVCVPMCVFMCMIVIHNVFIIMYHNVIIISAYIMNIGRREYTHTHAE